MSKVRRRTDKYTWYSRMFVVEMIDGTEYDVTWSVYAIGALISSLIVIAIFG